MFSFRNRRRIAGNGGFTLVEILIALTIAGLISAASFQMFRGISSFVQLQGAREEVQQNARASLEFIAGELRSIPADGWRVAAADSVAFHLPLAWGLVCDSLITASGPVRLILPETPIVRTSSTAAIGLAIRTDSSTNTWRIIQPATDQGLSATASTCRSGMNANAAHNQVRTFGGTGFPTTMLRRSRAYVFENVRYAPGPFSPQSGRWLLRNGEMMAGPLAEGTGLRFRYFNGETELAAPITNAAVLRTITHVEVTITTLSRNRVRGVPQRLSVSTTVYLRNS